MRKRDKIKKVVDRDIPKADLGSFEAPDLTGVKPLRKTDTDAILGIVKQLKLTGFIAKDNNLAERRQTMSEVNEIFSEAADHQRYENEINPEFYDETADKFLEQREREEGHLHEFSEFDTEAYFDQDECNERLI